ncbi:MAG: formylglycine-generating enzyme family protein [Candidatus Korobacteraceae bacterium]
MKRLFFLTLSVGGILLLPGSPTMAQAAPAAQVQSQSTKGHQATPDDSESESPFGDNQSDRDKPELPAAAPMTPADPSTPAGTTMVNPNDGLTYVWIPAGKFMMGCSPGDTNCDYNETPHEVTLDHGFWMGQTLVTQGAYKHVTGENPSFYKHGEQYPVEKVDYIDAYGYCVAVGMRLPSEAEWEYAARANTTGARYSDDLDSIAWYKDNSMGHSHPVAEKKPNGFGLYDMLGNMWEWTTDRSGTDAGGVFLRGGSWMVRANTLRVSNRGFDTPEGVRRFTSFRCVSGSYKDTENSSDETTKSTLEGQK